MHGSLELYGDVDFHEYNLGGIGKSQNLGTTGLVKLVRERGQRSW
jgi:hypothetical protein